MQTIDLLAYIAGFIGCVSSLPQLVKIMQTRQTKDLSYITLLMVIGSLGIWEVWGCMIMQDNHDHAVPVVVTNAISIAINSAVLLFKFKNEHYSVAQLMKGESGNEEVQVLVVKP